MLNAINSALSASAASAVSNPNVTITDNTTGKSVEMPVYQPTHGEPVVDIGALYKTFGYFTYDPGFVSTASCKSTITYLDGDKGELLYRGYPIEQLAEKSDFLEVCYLLLNGELPNAEQRADFSRTISRHTMINESLRAFFGADQFRAAVLPIGALLH